jgi:hypothetical protein
MFARRRVASVREIDDRRTTVFNDVHCLLAGTNYSNLYMEAGIVIMLLWRRAILKRMVPEAKQFSGSRKGSRSRCVREPVFSAPPLQCTEPLQWYWQM